MGPVQEKETITSVNAMKKMPDNPPFPAFWSALLAQLLGRFSSKAPKKEMAKTINMAKNKILVIAEVEMVYNTVSPKIKVSNKVGMV